MRITPDRYFLSAKYVLLSVFDFLSLKYKWSECWKIEKCKRNIHHKVRSDVDSLVGLYFVHRSWETANCWKNLVVLTDLLLLFFTEISELSISKCFVRWSSKFLNLALLSLETILGLSRSVNCLFAPIAWSLAASLYANCFPQFLDC